MYSVGRSSGEGEDIPFVLESGAAGLRCTTVRGSWLAVRSPHERPRCAVRTVGFISLSLSCRRRRCEKFMFVVGSGGGISVVLSVLILLIVLSCSEFSAYVKMKRVGEVHRARLHEGEGGAKWACVFRCVCNYSGVDVKLILVVSHRNFLGRKIRATKL